MKPRPSLPERIAKYMEHVDPAVSGSNGHTTALAAASALVWAWGLSEAEALPYLKAYNQRCEPPWNQAELEHKLSEALAYKGHKTPRGHLVGEEYEPGEDKPIEREPEPTKPVFEPNKLATLASKLDEPVDATYLEARSKFSCWNRSPAGVLHKLYKAGEKIVVFNIFKNQGCVIWEHPGLAGNLATLDHLKTGCEKGVWFLCQPVTGEFIQHDRFKTEWNPSGRSRRCEECVTSWRYVLLESDYADPDHWLKALVQWPLPIAAVYLSGDRSIHTLVRIDADSKEEWDSIVKDELGPKLVPFGTCLRSLSGVRLTRLPNCMREGKGNLQQLLYLDSDPDGVPICEKPVRSVTGGVR